MGRQIIHLLAGALLTLLPLLAVGWLGPIGLFCNLFVPLPAAYLGMRQGTPVAAGVVLLSAAVLLAGSGAAAAAYFLQFGLAAGLLVLFLRRGNSWDRAVAATTAIIAAVAGLVAGYFALTRNLSIAATVERYLRGETEKAMEIYRQAGMNAEQLEEMQKIVDRIGIFLVECWPGLAVAGTGMLLLLTICLLATFARGKYALPGTPFRLWKSPEHLVWLLISAGAGYLLSAGVVQQVAFNILLMILPIYFLQGLAILHFYFRQLNVGPFLRSFGYLLITFFPLPLFVTGLGVFDLWADFRKPRIVKTDP